MEATHEDWILTKLIKNPDAMVEISQQIRPWHFEGEKKKLYEILTSGIEKVPKRGANYEEVKNEIGEPILETRFTPTAINVIESKYAGHPYFSFLTSLDEPSLKELKWHVKGHLANLKRNRTMAVYQNAVDRLQQGHPLNDVSSEMDELLLELQRSYSDESLVATSAEAYEKLVSRTKEKIKTGQMRTSTGMAVLDYLLAGGIEPGDFFVLASKTGQGKSMFTLQMAYSMAMQLGKKVGILSLEMDEAENLKRIWTHLSFTQSAFSQHVDFYQSNFEKSFDRLTRNPEAWKDWQECEAEVLKETPVYYLKPKDISLAEMKKYCNLFRERYKCDVILLDHMLLVNDTQEERLIVKDISNFFKVFAAENNMIMMAVSQMNRGRGRDDLDSMNSIDDLSGGRSIEHAASQIVTISRLPKKKDGANPLNRTVLVGGDNVRKISLIKSRHSKDNTHFYCEFHGNSSTFKQIFPDNWEDVKDLDIPTEKLDYSLWE